MQEVTLTLTQPFETGTTQRGANVGAQEAEQVPGDVLSTGSVHAGELGLMDRAQLAMLTATQHVRSQKGFYALGTAVVALALTALTGNPAFNVAAVPVAQGLADMQ